MDKKELRKKIRQQSERFTDGEVIKSNQQLIHRLLCLPEYKEARVIFCYVSMKREIDTIPIFHDAFKQGKRVAVPKCLSKGVMEAYLLSDMKALQVGSFGILEPDKDCPLVGKERIDLAIMPCISCDRQGNRLGQGGGYYDRYLEDSAFTTAALCREELMSEQIPSEKWDHPVDIVITEHEIFRR